MNCYVDLHTHSTQSDGTLTPEELVTYASGKNLYAIALTDHDTIFGLESAIETGKQKLVYVIPGIELSTEYQGQDVHILGYFIDYKNEEFRKKIRGFQESRSLRNVKMVKKLQNGGYAITLEELYAIYGEDSVITRMHLAKALWDKGYVEDIPTAFATILSSDGPYYVPRERITPQDAVELITKYQGTAVLAHPLLYSFSEETRLQLLKDLKEIGLSGMECLYSTFDQKQQDYLIKLAKDFGLFYTGGSDFHGESKPHIDIGTGCNNLSVPKNLLNNFPQWESYRKNYLLDCVSTTQQYG